MRRLALYLAHQHARWLLYWAELGHEHAMRIEADAWEEAHRATRIAAVTQEQLAEAQRQLAHTHMLRRRHRQRTAMGLR